MASDRDGGWGWVLAIELLAYAVVAGAFLWAYVGYFHVPFAMVPRHLLLLATALIVPWGLRVLAWRLVGVQLARAVTAVLLVAPLALLAVWYALVILGLDAWGRVPTWPLIRTYLVQAPALLGVLGIAPWGLAAGLLMAGSVLVFLAWRYLAQRDWASRLARNGTASGIGAIAAGLMLMSGLLMYVQVQRGVMHSRDPVALAFLHGSSGLQSHMVRGSHVVDAREEAARQQYRPTSSHPARNLVVIVGDSLRADHMSLYGYGRETTPGLAAKARAVDTTVIRRVRSACAESSCGLMSLAASRRVAEVGSSPLTLQEVLKRHGYKVDFILGGDHTNFYGLKEMYGKLDSFRDGSGQSRYYINDDQLVLDMVRDLPVATPGQPVAFQFHLMSTHGLGRRDTALSPFQPSENYYRWPDSSPKRPPSEAAARGAVNYYDNGMVRFDYVASRILELLQQKGYLDDALVVVTGDHGEMLGEQGFFSHQHGVSEPVLDIPLVLFRYGYSGEPIPAPPLSNQIDVAPTVLRELGLPVPEIWQGRALQDPWIPRDIHVQQSHYFGIYRVDADGRVWKYVRDLTSGTESVTNPVDDPKGLIDLSDRIPLETLNGWRNQSMVGMLNSAPEFSLE